MAAQLDFGHLGLGLAEQFVPGSISRAFGNLDFLRPGRSGLGQGQVEHSVFAAGLNLFFVHLARNQHPFRNLGHTVVITGKFVLANRLNDDVVTFDLNVQAFFIDPWHVYGEEKGLVGFLQVSRSGAFDNISQSHKIVVKIPQSWAEQKVFGRKNCGFHRLISFVKMAHLGHIGRCSYLSSSWDWAKKCQGFGAEKMNKSLVDRKKIECSDLCFKYLRSILAKAEKSLGNYVEKYPFMAKRIVQVIRKDFRDLEISKLSYEMRDENILASLQKKTKIEGKFLFYDLKRDLIYLTFFGYFYYFFKFVFFWSAAVAMGAFSLLKKGDQKSANIVLGLIDQQYLKSNSTEEFEKFCVDGPIPELRQSSYYVCSGKPIYSRDKFHYCPYPLFGSLEKCETGIGDIFSLVGFQLKYFLEFCTLAISRPLVLVLALDYAEFGIVDFLNSRNFINNFFVTQSNIYEQRLWFSDLPSKKFKAIMLWYSANSRPIQTSILEHSSMPPGIFLLRTDIHFVWTYFEKEWLASHIPCGEVRVCGPILFYTENFKNIQFSLYGNSSLNISIFDITPRKGFLAPGSFEYWKAFVDGILGSCREIKNETDRRIRIFLKPKRRDKNPLMCSNYIPYIEQTKDIALLDPEVSIYQLCDISDVVIVLPFSSPAILCHERKGNATYYDPSGMFTRPEARMGVPICFHKEELKKFVYQKARICLKSHSVSRN